MDDGHTNRPRGMHALDVVIQKIRFFVLKIIADRS